MKALDKLTKEQREIWEQEYRKAKEAGKEDPAKEAWAVLEFNPYHDERGQFAESGGGHAYVGMSEHKFQMRKDANRILANIDEARVAKSPALQQAVRDKVGRTLASRVITKVRSLDAMSNESKSKLIDQILGAEKEFAKSKGVPNRADVAGLIGQMLRGTRI